MNPNEKGLFEIINSNLSLKGCQFDQIYDINDTMKFSNQVSMNNYSFDSRLKNYNVLDVFDDQSKLIENGLNKFKGGIVSESS